MVDALEASPSLLHMARWLGTDCLQNRRTLRHDLYVDLSDTCSDLLQLAATESKAMWDATGAFLKPPSADLKGQLLKLSITPALAAVTVLRGICRGVARDYFANVSTVVTFDRGCIVPLSERRLAKAVQAANLYFYPQPGLPPNPRRTHSGLLGDCNFVIWDMDDWILELDFTFRDRLDLVCTVRTAVAGKDGGKGELAPRLYTLPKMATVHPHGTHDMAVPDESTASTFFGVHPAVSHGDEADAVHRRVFDALALVPGDVPIAVMPEFCLLSPDGLDALIQDDDREIPALVVAGSAHTGLKNRHMRANTSRVFLDRYPVMSVSKHEPFVLSFSDGKFNYSEDIKPQDPRVIRVAAGTATRLTVAICSDLNSSELIGAMTKAGINMLLTPSWSPKVGAAATALTQLAGYCQCVGLVANTPGHLMADGQPTFWACTAVPRDSDQAHVHYNGEWDVEEGSYHEAPPPVVGVLNPNVLSTDPDYWRWFA